MAVLSFDNVGLTYFSKNGETEALKDINFTIKDKEFVAIIGPSGCGKTTILSLSSGLLKQTKGKITLDQKDINKLGHDSGYCFQKDYLFEWRTIEKNVLLALEISHQKTKENIELAHSLLKKYGLWEFKDKYPNQLSGGMRQRVALIRTLVLSPKILLLDEPFSALDFQTRLNAGNNVYDIIKNEEITAILVTHDISEAISMADRILVLSPRPATIKYELTLDFDKSLTPLNRRERPEFSKYFDILWKELQNE